MIGRADIEGSKSNVAMNAWSPQAAYPRGNFSDTSSFKFRRSKGSIGHAFTARIRTGNRIKRAFTLLSFTLETRCGYEYDRRERYSGPPIFKGRRGAPTPPTCGAFQLADPTSAEPFPVGGSVVKQKITLPEAPADVSDSLTLPSTAASLLRILTRFPFEARAKHVSTGLPRLLDRLTHVQVPFTWNLSPLRPSKFSFEYLLLPPRSAPTEAPPARALGFTNTAAPSYSSKGLTIAPTAGGLRVSRHPFSGLVDSK
ncbi:hypothetical protein Syun_031939 [Stephania yunnanensis]|uniref:Uncharacterized protein n=1 Tax=Stephania yunnanensis TaxID=152371 RepID=A0AAP0E133_9MAGN